MRLIRRATFGSSVFAKSIPHSPKLRRMFDELNVAIRVNLPVQRRKELRQIQALDHVEGSQRTPGFIECRRRGEMSGTGSDSGNQDAHKQEALGSDSAKIVDVESTAFNDTLERAERDGLAPVHRHNNLSSV
jgi:hypothetical protein